ncbi:MAG: hypothetical protein JWR80_8117 [Bradyrhizobium sp.]|nr:hypothetical protein [Bradyrhizobium sp.]
MESSIAFIGFGEAAAALAGGTPGARAYDLKTDAAETRAAKLADYAQADVRGVGRAAEALRDAEAVLSLVTADQALPAARHAAGLLRAGALWLDMNSVAPDTKREAALAIEAAGGRYVDVAVLAPVHPQRLAVPLLVSGPHAEAGATQLRAIGFTNVRIVGGGVGKASAIKMIRSVMVKGLEALTAEWILAAEAAGIRDEAVAALNASWPGTDWAAKADYNLERMMVHGTRRAVEMEEVVKTLDALGTGSAMTRGTVERQRALGRLAHAAPASLDDKLALLLGKDTPDNKEAA